MKLEGIPVREIYKNPEKKFALMEAVMNGSLESVDKEFVPTAIDFPGIPPSLTREGMLEWIRKETGIDPKIILDNGKSPESRDKYFLLNYAFQQTKNFLRDTLKYSEKELFLGVDSIKSKEDIFKILEKTKLTGDKEGLSQSIKYCRIVKTTIATYEALRNDSQLLKKITEDFEGALVSSPSEGETTINTPLVFSGKYHNETGQGFRAINDSNLEGSINSRAKDFEKIILKFLTRPDSDAKAALKDGIASRITIEKDQAVKLLPELYEWLTKTMKATDIKIENKSFFSTSQMKKLFGKIKISNAPKDEKFEAIFITGKLHSSSHGGQFEMQLVDPSNKNEEGGMDHNIYDVKKFVNARTRLDGGCPEDIFEKFVFDAHIKSGISIKEIKHELIEETDSPIIRKRKKNGKYVYITKKVYKRWAKFRWINESLKKELDIVVY
ncbi:MAG: hypothetical protein PHT16_00555 [Candidatus Pacebacteria bacterium]|nr:hypothetical protein [Candidatus Paceibacterota bacterium]